MPNSFQIAIALIFWFEWAVRVAAFFIVPRNRKPSSATAWLMLIMVFPIIGLLLFVFVGSPKLSRRRRDMQKTMDAVIRGAVEEAKSDPSLKHFVLSQTTDRIRPIVDLNTRLGALPAFTGNGVELLDDYENILITIAKDIDAAERFIHLEFFILAMDDATEPIFVAIEKAIKRGVKVRVLYDGLISRRYPRIRKMRKRLTAIGVEWHTMLPLKLPGRDFNRLDLRNHRKIVVIDNEIGYTGSLNIIQRDYHRRDDLYYDELMVRLQGPIVTQLHGIFITDWYAETGELLSRENCPEITMQPKKAGNVLAQSLPSGPGYDNDNNLKLFTSLLYAAKTSIVIVNPYFVPDEALLVALTTAAQRGVKVRMINSEVMDQRMVGHAQRSYYEEILTAGIEIHTYKPPILLHSKFITIDDDIAVIGSSNLDMRSFQLDLEVSLVIYDTSVVSTLKEIETTYFSNSNQLTLEQWKQRPLRKQLFDNIARLTAMFQ